MYLQKISILPANHTTPGIIINNKPNITMPIISSNSFRSRFIFSIIKISTMAGIANIFNKCTPIARPINKYQPFKECGSSAFLSHLVAAQK